MKLYNRNFPCTERIEYMGWVNEGIPSASLPWQTYKPRFLTLKGMDILLFDSPPVSLKIAEKTVTNLKASNCHLTAIKSNC